MKIKNYKFEGTENFKYLKVILNEYNNYQIDLRERIKNANKIYFMLQKYFRNKNISKKLKLRLKKHNNKQNSNICFRNLDTNKERWKANEHFLKEIVLKNFRLSI